MESLGLGGALVRYGKFLINIICKQVVWTHTEEKMFIALSSINPNLHISSVSFEDLDTFGRIFERCQSEFDFAFVFIGGCGHMWRGKSV